MHILFFAPYFNQPRGNSTTIKRIVHYLQQQSISTSVIPYLEDDNWNYPDADLFHILHATRFIQWAEEKSFRLNRPYVVTMGGTDINLDLQESIDEEMLTFLNNANYITVFTEDAKEKVEKLSAKWMDKTVVIPQGIWLPWSISTRKEEFSPRILLPAGLRPVKDVLHILPALDRLIYEYPNMSFTILGANLDNDVYREVQKEAGQRKWMNYAGVVPYEVMKIWYDQSQIVINTSQSEGQSLALMEAMAIGRPVIARANEANRDLIRHEQTGWLYETMDRFAEGVHSIVENVSLREKVVHQAKEWVTEHYSAEKEADSYLNLYKHL
ncbi:glycosyltransferase [Peribacillus cavernae]|uniref:Glycosyltransferase n=1 Tax=Peribacillus cavernae TaxID=1674310 RepID=A0A433HSU2_9BACI|nr:glycosyltransferase [Peribacillus cavernae]MDQ0218371.1 glycosyltransferase involved in cell wall biosynthesis [Peribacillus cavernae]RUQ31382.1 glycosyltransferase [Peribacillus cavernae]